MFKVTDYAALMRQYFRNYWPYLIRKITEYQACDSKPTWGLEFDLAPSSIDK